MLELVRGEGGGGRAEAMGAAARRRAAEVFSRSAFGAELEREVREMLQEKEEKKKSEKDKKRR